MRWIASWLRAIFLDEWKCPEGAAFMMSLCVPFIPLFALFPVVEVLRSTLGVSEAQPYIEQMMIPVVLWMPFAMYKMRNFPRT